MLTWFRKLTFLRNSNLTFNTLCCEKNTKHAKRTLREKLKTLNIKKTGKLRIKVTFRCIRLTIFGMKKQQVLNIPSVWLWPYLSNTQCACAILSSVARHARLYFSTLSHKRHYFLKKKLKTLRFDIRYKVCPKYFLF